LCDLHLEELINAAQLVCITPMKTFLKYDQYHNSVWMDIQHLSIPVTITQAFSFPRYSRIPCPCLLIS